MDSWINRERECEEGEPWREMRGIMRRLVSSREEKGGWKDKWKGCLELGWAGSHTLMLQNVCRNCQSFSVSQHDGYITQLYDEAGWWHADQMLLLCNGWCACECMCCCMIASQVALQAKCHWRPLSVLFFSYISHAKSVFVLRPSFTLSLCRPFCWLD